MARLYRLIAVSVEAEQLKPENAAEVTLWCGGLEVEEIDPHDSTKKFVGINVPTRNGVKRASQGAYVVKSMKNEFTVMEAEDFEAQFELA